MMRSIRVPEGLAALAARRRATSMEVGVPLYLPAFEPRLLEAQAQRDDDVDHGVEAEGVTIGGDEDDDFY